jgi:predicted metal-dependent hydrolase
MDPAHEPLFRHGIELFNRERFFECHEVLEEVWTPTRGPERLFLQALIHFAVGFYHHQRRNQAGAERQLRKGLKKIGGYLPSFLGVATEPLRAEVASRLLVIERGGEVQRFPRIHRETVTR